MGRSNLWCVLLLAGCGDNGGDGTTDADSDGVAAGDDCNDGDASIHPGADELCNETDDDCDGDIDEEAVDAQESFPDADGDGYGRGQSQLGCGIPNGRSPDAGDCDDANPNVNPGATEVCNGGVDDDCDGPADDDDGATGGGTYYADADGDGFGAGAPIEACVQGPGLSDVDSDCDDAAEGVNPDATETCNGFDDDCSASTSEDGTIAVGPTAYGSIQAALDAAAGGATVNICTGTFDENLAVARSVVLQGLGATETIIDGGDTAPVVRVSGSSVDLTIRGVSLVHGRANNVAEIDAAGGGGVQAFEALSLTIEDCTIESSEGQVAGGILGPDDGDVTIARTTVRDNDALAGAGGGLVLSGSPTKTIEITDSEITENTSTYFGGGIAILDGSAGTGSATITNTLIDGNRDETSGSLGGGLVSVASLTLSGVTISNNVADWGGGAYVALNDVTADDTTEVRDNVTLSYGFGGGIFVDSCAWDGGYVSGNGASQGGGAMVAWGSQIRNTIIEGNEADFGGGVWIWDAGVLEDVELLANAANVAGGGVVVSAEDDSFDAIVDGCTINENTAVLQGGGAQAEAPFESIDTDWGTGSTDNAPDDVLFYYDVVSDQSVAYTDFGAAESFTCDMTTHECE